METKHQSPLDEDELAKLQQKVRAEPMQPHWRFALFQRYCQLGQWHKAVGQLQAYARMAPSATAFAHAYRIALQQEQVRERVFLGEADPELANGCADWVHQLAAALKLQATDPEQAQQQRLAAFMAAPEVSGRVDGQPFNWIADADSRLGPVCELILDGCYQWIPYCRFQSLRISAPSHVCDLVWLQAEVTLLGETDPRPAFIPSRYPVSNGTGAEQLAATLTTWTTLEGDFAIGQGPRILVTDAIEASLLDIRCIDFDAGTKGRSDAQKH